MLTNCGNRKYLSRIFAISARDKHCDFRKNQGMAKSRDELAEWLKTQFNVSGKSKGGLARAWGVDAAAVSKVIKGERDMKAAEMEVAQAYFDSADAPRDEHPDELPSIPEIDVRAGAGGGGIAFEVSALDGNGSLIQADDVKATWVFPPKFVRDELRSPASAVRIVEVLGDSMEPTLKPGDRILIDTNHRAPSPPGVYAVWDGFGVVIKRVEPAGNKERPMVRLISDNKNHTSYEVSIEDAHIIGRAICRISTM